jgi:hypothetical protein
VRLGVCASRAHATDVVASETGRCVRPDHRDGHKASGATIVERGRGFYDAVPLEHPNTRSVAMAGRKSASKARAARPTTVAAYLAALTPERRAVIEDARAFVHKHIAEGYAEFMNWGVINWGIPLEQFADTYNGQPLCYVGLGAQKNYNSLYLMGAYDGSDGAQLLADAFKQAGKRLDMGKCCLRFKALHDLELTSVAKLIAMSTPKDYIAYYKRTKGLTMRASAS